MAKSHLGLQDLPKYDSLTLVGEVKRLLPPLPQSPPSHFPSHWVSWNGCGNFIFAGFFFLKKAPQILYASDPINPRSAPAVLYSKGAISYTLATGGCSCGPWSQVSLCLWLFFFYSFRGSVPLG